MKKQQFYQNPWKLIDGFCWRFLDDGFVVGRIDGVTIIAYDDLTEDDFVEPPSFPCDDLTKDEMSMWRVTCGE